MCKLLSLTGPSQVERVPEIGEDPPVDLLQSLDVRWKGYAAESWWTMQGRVVVSQYAPEHYALLCIVGGGGRAKYDPVVENEVTRLVVLANKAALIALKCTEEHARAHGRPRHHDLATFTKLRDEVEVKIREVGLENELDDARYKLAIKAAWFSSRRVAASYSRSRAVGQPMQRHDTDDAP